MSQSLYGNVKGVMGFCTSDGNLKRKRDSVSDGNCDRR